MRHLWKYIGLGFFLLAVTTASVIIFYTTRGSESDLVSDNKNPRGLVVAVRPNYPSFVTVDLNGNTQTFGPDVHDLPLDAISGVALSQSGDLVVSVSSRVFIFESADLAQASIELKLPKLDFISGVANELYTAPTQDGMGIWVVQPALATSGGESYNSRAYLVATDGSTILGYFEDSRRLIPVGTTDQKALIVTSDEGVIQKVTETGEFLIIGSGSFIGAGRNHIVWVDSSGDLVAFSAGKKLRVTMPIKGRKWAATGHDFIPSVQIPSWTVTSDGRVLVEVVVEVHSADAEAY